jgi:hypothetical protein
MFIIETYCVLCEVETRVFESPTSNHWVLGSFPGQCETCDGESDRGTSFSLSNSVFPCQCHSAIAPSSPKYCYYKDKRTKPGKLPTKHLTIKHSDVCSM